jgi:hypothetical protein
LHANRKWSTWRDGDFARSVALAQAPVTRVRWMWTRMQVVLTVLVLAASSVLAVLIAETVAGAFRLVAIIAVTPGTLGVSYLLLARRIRSLEQERGVVCFWQRQPGIDDIERVGVYTVPIHAIAW